MFDNIRSGDWLLDYTTTRTKECRSFHNVNKILSSLKDNYKTIPDHIKPRLFCLVIDGLYNQVKKSVLKQLNVKMVNKPI